LVIDRREQSPCAEVVVADWCPGSRAEHIVGVTGEAEREPLLLVAFEVFVQTFTVGRMGL